MISIKTLSSLFILSAIVCLCSANYVDWDSMDNEKRMTPDEASKFLDTYKRLFGGKDEEIREDNNELGERRSEAFEAYEEKCEPVFHVGKRACPPINTCDSADVQNPFLQDLPIFLKRELANEFNNQLERREDEFYQQIFKRKQDAEEIREIELKADARRKKAYKNYEESCKIKGKFTVRTCPKLQECTAKNKQTYIPLLAEKKNSTTAAPVTTTTTKAPMTTVKKSFFPFGKGSKREFIERALALSFLEPEVREEEADDDSSDDDDGLFKRFLGLGKKVDNKELIEETKERRDKAFKKYEEYCEKRLFRIGSKRNCPPLDKKLC
ncbi:unnamed protein product [Brachionus calyciflorus]|uniref:Uncharacterized protein n=1 Tax=Brachionus calyciflorus TaxID=104777 RepID=A0A814KW73_9BILA|nr:unnamed protein product [Brachionus calyciflorus]